MTDETTTPDEGDGPTMTPAQMREHLLEGAVPMDGAPIYERPGMKGSGNGYEMAGKTLGRAMLEVAEADPKLLDVTAEREADPTGWQAANNEKLWQAVLAKYPGIDDWIGGVTGFMYGWAHNAVRYALDAGPTGNPALVTIRTTDADDLSEAEKTALDEGALPVDGGEA